MVQLPATLLQPAHVANLALDIVKEVAGNDLPLLRYLPRDFI